MPIGTPTGVGNTTQGTTTTPAITTTGAVPSSSMIFLIMGHGAAGTRTLSSVSGGGLTWDIDHQQTFSGAAVWGFDIVSAQAPAGLSSGTTITATYDIGGFGTLLATVYCTGLATSSAKDVSAGQGEAAVTAWDTSSTSTTVADTLVIGGSLRDGLNTNTASGGANELYDFQYGAESWSMCVEYKILSGTASTNLTGTWTGGNVNSTSAFVAYKGGAAGADTGLAWIRA